MCSANLSSTTSSINMDMILFLHSVGCPWSIEAVHTIACKGTVQQLQWLYENGCPLPTPSTGHHVVKSHDSLPKLMWLGQLQRESEFDERTMVFAVRRGDFASIKYLRSRGCPWNAECSEEAATRKDGALLRWLHDNGCPWDISTATATAASLVPDNVDRFEYLVREGLVSTPEDFTLLMNVAGSWQNIELAQWIRSEHKAAWPLEIYEDWPQELLLWARKEGCTAPVAVDYFL
jgi:hypothetical protein